MKTRLITLSRGLSAIVDADDYEHLSQWNWWVENSRGKLYAIRYEDKKRICMHRLVNKTPKGLETDHINGDGLDNRKKNLRAATHKQNSRNRKPHNGGTSKFKGVHWSQGSKKWRAMIKIGEKLTSLGYFKCEIDACRAYEIAAQQAFGEFYQPQIIKGVTPSTKG